MIDPYRMIFINVTSSVILVVGLIIYVYILKKKVNLLILLILISVLPIISIFRSGTYESGDFNIHIYRIISFYESLTEGNIIPSWAENLNAKYGYPIFIFNYQFPYFVISLFKFLGMTFIISTKIYLALSFILSGIFMFIWIYKLTHNRIAAFASSIFYLFSPYHLIDLHFRATLGEMTVFTFTPLLFYFVTSLRKTKKIIYAFLSALTLFVLFLSHSLLAGVIFLITILYVIFNLVLYKNLKIFFLELIALTLGLSISIYSWLPFLIYRPYTLQDTFLQISYYPFIQLIYSPWQFGFLFQGPKGELSLLIGYFHIFVLIVSIIFLILRKVHNKLKPNFYFWTLLSLFEIFMINPVSEIIWEQFLILSSLLPTGRLSLLIAFSISVLAGFFTLQIYKGKFGKLAIYILLFLAIYSTILNWGHRRVVTTIDDNFLIKNLPLSTSQGEGHFYANSNLRNPNDPWFKEIPKLPIYVQSGNAEILLRKRTSIEHLYQISSSEKSNIIENTLFFPGWELKVNSKITPIIPTNEGLISFVVDEGNYNIKLRYEDIPLYKYSKQISLILLFFTLLVILSKFLLRLKLKSK